MVDHRFDGVVCASAHGFLPYVEVSVVPEWVQWEARALLGSTLLRRSQRVALKAHVLPKREVADFSIAFGLMRCCLFTGRTLPSRSGSWSGVASEVRDLVPCRFQISFFFPFATCLTSCLRSQARGSLCMGNDVGSREAASVSSHSCAKAVASLGGVAAVAAMARYFCWKV